MRRYLQEVEEAGLQIWWLNRNLKVTPLLSVVIGLQTVTKVAAEQVNCRALWLLHSL